MRTSFFDEPARVVVISFVGVGLLGGAILTLPTAAHGEPIALRDALFTAFSAVCVTGLSTLDVGTRLTGFGQVVLLALIQIGGLGIMAFSIATVAALRRKLSVSETELLSYMLEQRNRSEVLSNLRTVLRYTLGIEAIGALVLTVAFVSAGYEIAPALWHGVFHSISAFCNAGFSLYSDSLGAIAHMPLAMTTISILIVAGGLGFATLTWLRQRDPNYRLAAQVSLSAAALLIAVAAVVFYLAERRSLLSDMSLASRYGHALFQSVTLRTAGFSTVEFADAARATLLIVLPFMAIGAASGGTAGGVKVGTAYVLVQDLARLTRRRRDIVAAGRRIPDPVASKASAIVLMFTAFVGLATLILAAYTTEPLEQIVFEVVSALGTVGLSSGVTGRLDGFGLAVLVACMLVGRLGPLTLVGALRQPEATVMTRYPKGNLPIG